MRQYLLLFIFFITCNVLSISANEYIKNIEVSGNTRTDTSTIIKYSGYKVGGVYDPKKTKDVVSKLYHLGRFENIKIRFNNSNLLINVEERYFVNSVVISGNHKKQIGEMIKKNITMKKGNALDLRKVQHDIRVIQALYEKMGINLLNVSYNLVPLSQNSNNVKLVYNVKQGPAAYVKKIHFIGNKAVSTYKLKNILITKEKPIFLPILNPAPYDLENIEMDKEIIKNYYHGQGFADCQVLSVTTTLSPSKEHYTITYSILEGEEYKVSEVNIDNQIKGITKKELAKLIEINTNDVYNLDKIYKSIKAIKKHFQSKGYRSVIVNHNVRNNFSNNSVALDFTIENTPKVLVRNINIIGNNRTHDNVIRREMEIEEGDVYDNDKIEVSRIKILRSGFFQNASIVPVAANFPGYTDLLVTVEETNTLNMILQLAYTSDQGLTGTMGLSDNNFAGTGNTIQLNFNKAVTTKKTDIVLAFTVPKIYNTDVSVYNSLTLSLSDQDEQSYYNGNSLVFTTGIGHYLLDDLYHSSKYKFKYENLTIADTRKNADGAVVEVLRDNIPSIITESEGTYYISSVINTLEYNTINNPASPTNGYMIKGMQEIAGIGGNVTFIKHILSFELWKMFYKDKFTFHVSGSLGNIFDHSSQKYVRFVDRFALGGEGGLRGFEYSGIGPKDRDTQNSLRGTNYYQATAEIMWPINIFEEQKNMFKGAVFADIGGLWGVNYKNDVQKSQVLLADDMKPRLSAGFSLLINIPSMPLRMNWSWPIIYDKENDSISKDIWSVGVGYQW